jgi:hypothetical protein
VFQRCTDGMVYIFKLKILKLVIRLKTGVFIIVLPCSECIDQPVQFRNFKRMHFTSSVISLSNDRLEFAITHVLSSILAALYPDTGSSIIFPHLFNACLYFPSFYL